MSDLREGFVERVLGAYGRSQVIKASAAPIEVRSGHPRFDELELGERAEAPVVAVFLDLSDFTGRSFWDPPAEVAMLADAVLAGFTGVVTELGGHVLGLRGDGLFAGFGPGRPVEDVALAGLAAAASLDATRNRLNPRLEQMGIHPVSARAGIDYGSLTFVRTGNERSSEVNVVGFAANLAAKAEKVANAWEVVVGEGYADCVANSDLLKFRAYKSFERNGDRKLYRLSELRWKQLLPELDGAVKDLARVQGIKQGAFS